MKKALIIYLSKKGTTKYFGHNIGKYLDELNVETKVISMHDVEPSIVQAYDLILFGCWTHGLFVLFQHPEKQWVKFVKSLPEMKDKKVALFTTYKIATGSMFKKMESAIINKIDGVNLTLKAKGEELDDKHKVMLKKLLNEDKT